MQRDVQGIHAYYTGGVSAIKVDDVLNRLRQNKIPETWLHNNTIGNLKDLQCYLMGINKGNHIMRDMLVLDGFMMEIGGELGMVAYEPGEQGCAIGTLYGCFVNQDGVLDLKQGSEMLTGGVKKMEEMASGYIDLPIYRNEKRQVYLGKIYLKCKDKEIIRLRSCAVYLQ